MKLEGKVAIISGAAAGSTYLFSNAVIPEFNKQGGGVILDTASATAPRIDGGFSL